MENLYDGFKSPGESTKHFECHSVLERERERERERDTLIDIKKSNLIRKD